ncbi:SpoVR family protein [Hirschia maritima]|uniref:SpoVR family protein n=1 Tax=Hirschia maritima TaxID=1121961 RepID=UPI000375A09B|nr:SpoVR family protein [Hirschia maritima]
MTAQEKVKTDETSQNNLLFEEADWDAALIDKVYNAIDEIAIGEMKLEPYPSQIEVITSEQMLDAYASTGMPLFYNHWSFGKQFAYNEAMYRKGYQGLAYEIVINSDPCVCYIMEENSATMQTLVIAHAAFGHSHFFRNNYVFKQWTDASGIIDYLAFAKSFIAKCEDKYGPDEVEKVLDSAHALQSHGIHRYPKKRQASLAEEADRERLRREHGEALFNDLWRTVPDKEKKQVTEDEAILARQREILGLPEENILYFLEKTAPRLEPWKREILRIVRLIAQYFYPQRQTKMMNEGCATYTHHRIMTRLHEKGQISDGSYLEFLHSHSGVVMQPEFDDQRFSGINPYALGFAMCEDIERICNEPTHEDLEWFPDIAGRGNHMEVLKDIWANFRDESFVLQYLSPHLIRKLGLFHIVDDSEEDEIEVAAIHDERGYLKVRRALSRDYDVSRADPNIQVSDVDLAGDRCLNLTHYISEGVLLDADDTWRVMRHLCNLWGYPVALREVDPNGKVVEKYVLDPEDA